METLLLKTTYAHHGMTAVFAALAPLLKHLVPCAAWTTALFTQRNLLRRRLRHGASISRDHIRVMEVNITLAVCLNVACWSKSSADDAQSGV